MATSVELLGPREAWAPPPAKALDEEVWQAWLAKGRERSRRTAAAWTRAVKWVSIAGLLAAAVIWSHLAPFDVVIRFVVTGGAIAVMSKAFQGRQYAVAVAFAALALLYNPLAPVFNFSGAAGNALWWPLARSPSPHHSLGAVRGRNAMTRFRETALSTKLIHETPHDSSNDQPSTDRAAKTEA